ncbi:unnamed protein product [Colias eurytheme]|nr:unnamed protein product [Colias eurytheme]
MKVSTHFVLHCVNTEDTLSSPPAVVLGSPLGPRVLRQAARAAAGAVTSQCPGCCALGVSDKRSKQRRLEQIFVGNGVGPRPRAPALRAPCPTPAPALSAAAEISRYLSPIWSNYQIEGSQI